MALLIDFLLAAVERIRIIQVFKNLTLPKFTRIYQRNSIII